MISELFVFALAVMFALLFLWAFRTLPTEGWQILAAVPVSKDTGGAWKGLNLTYYGFFVATACAFSVIMILVLMGSIRTPLFGTATVITTILLVCLPASRIVAKIVERKRHTVTIGGASFIGILIAPPVVYLINAALASHSGITVPVLPLLGAIAIAYAFGEAVGRLACISFGCCYGKSVSLCHPRLRNIFRRYYFVFTGETKKVAYEGAMAGEPVVPIQAITSLVFAVAGLAGTFLFLKACWIAALVEPLVITQSWRVCSEMLRADYRGGGRISAYQIMAVLAIPYVGTILPFFLSVNAPLPNIMAGLQALLNPWVILTLEGLWSLVFLYLGRSMVTASRVSFHVVQERV